MKMLWMDLVYSHICRKYLEYLKEKEKRSIRSIEYILVIMHHESLKKGGKRLLRYPIYIDGEEVRIFYISDLLRVMPPTMFGPDGIHNGREMDRYSKMLNKYKKMPEEEVKEQALNIVNMGYLPQKDVVFRKYNNKYMRILARQRANKRKYPYKALLKFLLGLFNYGPTTLLIGLLIQLLVFKDRTNIPDLAYISVVNLIFLPPWIIWTVRWSKPTSFERENGYNLE
ncbi:MAG: hypothetical protein ACRC6X_01515 [Culicoidibacterales bacterium]